MPVLLDVSEFISALGAPTTAVALAVGLVRGARALETDANPQALKYVARLLIDRNFATFGRLGPTLIPLIFDRVFGSHPLSWKFILRSMLATTIFWICLGLIKNLSWSDIKMDFQESGDTYVFIFPIFYLFDWISLIKARLILRLLLKSHAAGAGLVFLVIDVVCSYAIAYFAIIIFALTYWFYSLHELMSQNEFQILLDSFINLGALYHYLDLSGNAFNPRGVVVPSTMLTSIWTFLLIISGMIAQLLVPLDYLRRFTAWWFRDVENHPLTAIAKVGAALILIGSVLIKVPQWI
jgi:hypothetical protein